MKPILLLSIAFLMQSAAASDAIQAHRINNCSFWTYSNPSSGNSGYVCSSYPSTVTVPDAYSVSDQLKRLSTRIEELEKRIAELESR